MTENQKRKNIALPIELHAKLAALATTEGTTTTRLIRRVLTEYLDSRADDVDDALRFVADYQNSLEAFRERKSAE